MFGMPRLYRLALLFIVYVLFNILAYSFPEQDFRQYICAAVAFVIGMFALHQFWILESELRER